MLPILIYEPDDAVRAQLLDALDVTREPDMPKTRVELSTGSIVDLQRAVQAQEGILLAIIGVHPGKAVECARQGSEILDRNRNSYTIYCLHDTASLTDLLDNCLRPAGIQTVPWSENGMRGCIRRVLEDYLNLMGPEEKGKTLVIEANNSAYRIPLNELLYVEALDKMITLHTRRQNITLRNSLGALTQVLPERFIRCHRAFVVNADLVDHADFANMSLTMSNGDLLPISRGQRNTVKEAILPGKGAPS